MFIFAGTDCNNLLLSPEYLRQLENEIRCTTEKGRSCRHLQMPHTTNGMQSATTAAEATGTHQEIFDKYSWKRD